MGEGRGEGEQGKMVRVTCHERGVPEPLTRRAEEGARSLSSSTPSSRLAVAGRTQGEKETLC